MFPLVATAAQDAIPEETLLSGLAGDLRHPGLRCEWIGGRYETLDDQLSLYREELSGFHVLVDGEELAGSATGAVLAVEFEARLIGPATVAVALDAARAPRVASLAPGRRVEIYFSDRRSRLHPLFCGELAFLSKDSSSSRVDLVAAMPRAGTDDKTSELWQNMTCADVLKRLGNSAGLEMIFRDTRQQTVFPTITRTQQAAWPFMRVLARECRYDIVLEPGGRLTFTQSTFVAPTPVVQQWIDLSLPHIVKRLAAPLGRTANLDLRGSYPPTSVSQKLPDEEFLASLAEKMQASVWYVPNSMLFVREDGVWNLTAAPLPAGGGDTLLWRITATGGSSRSFTRHSADPAALASDPERVPLMQTTLSLGKSMAVASMPRLALADRATTAALLEAAIARLAQSSGVTPERRFLRAYAQAYRPTLIHLYRLRPGGLQVLDTIGR